MSGPRGPMLLAALLVGSGCLGGPAPSPLPVGDVGIRAAIAAELAGDPETQGVTVDTRDGLVTLRGRVPGVAAENRAVKRARGVAGVRAVRSELVLEAAEAPAPR